MEGLLIPNRMINTMKHYDTYIMEPLLVIFIQYKKIPLVKEKDNNKSFFMYEYGSSRKTMLISLWGRKGSYGIDVYKNNANHNNKVDILHYRYKKVCKHGIKYVFRFFGNIIQFENQDEMKKQDQKILEFIQEEEKKVPIQVAMNNTRMVYGVLNNK